MTFRIALAALVSALIAAPVAGAAGPLPNGKYPCWGISNYLGFDIVVTGSTTYSVGGKAGRYAVSGSKVVFASGPMKGFFGGVLKGPRIGLNSNGSSFYSTTCHLDR